MTPDIDPSPIGRVCAACEELMAPPARSQAVWPVISPAASHGLCRRHFIEALQHAGCSAAEIQAELEILGAYKFCADLGPGRPGHQVGTANSQPATHHTQSVQ